VKRPPLSRSYGSIGRRRRGGLRWSLAILAAAVLAVGVAASAGAISHNRGRGGFPAFTPESLDGSGNNLAHPEWGTTGRAYGRVAKAFYKDGISQLSDGPNVRMVSNRIIADGSQNVFSENNVTQWVWQWGQFMDHVFGLAEGGGEAANIPFNANDPLEKFRNDLGVISFTRDKATPGTGTSTSNPRQQTNTLSSYIDAFNVYGPTASRLEWLRDGSVDGNVTNNRATLMLKGGYLPTREARGDPGTAPTMVVDGRLLANPTKAVVAGDVRANENIGLTATHTLFAREHNRIVSKLPRWLPEELKFQIARKIVIAEEQFVTYNEFLPAVGVKLPAYAGYKRNVDATLSTEFATVGYRMHSGIHGEFELEVDADHYTKEQLESFEEQGLEVEVDGDEAEIAVPLNVMFFNPGLLKQIGLGELLKAIGGEVQYNNDEMIDNHLRSILFQVPNNSSHDCQEPVDPTCFKGVLDLGAIDIFRARDHGIPNYNALRVAYGLPPKTSFRAITGESSESFPGDTDADNPNMLDFTSLHDKNGAPIALDSPVANNEAVQQTRRAPLAARLKAAYGTVDKVDAFAGMISEKHVPGAEFGELQLAIWTKQFQALRDGDRFFYRNDPVLDRIRHTFGIDFRHSLAEIIAANTDIKLSELRPNVFVNDEDLAPGRILSTPAKRCLDVLGGKPSNGGRLQLADCKAGDGQGWRQSDRGAIRVFENKCLDVLNHHTAPGSTVAIWDCNGGANQRWRFTAEGTIVGAESGKCLTPVDRGRSTRIEIQVCSGDPNQRWIR
jgi:Animal haem peroxidase/Ricin-type beta-trefoil lectin domain